MKSSTYKSVIGLILIAVFCISTPCATTVNANAILPTEMTITDVTSDMDNSMLEGYENGLVSIESEEQSDFSDDDYLDAIVSLSDSSMIDKYLNVYNEVYDTPADMAASYEGNALRQNLLKIQEKVITKIESITADFTIKYNYLVTQNAISIRTQYKYLEDIAHLDGVDYVEICESFEAPDAISEDDNSLENIVVDAIGNVSFTGKNIVDSSKLAYKGEGQLIAILDTGVSLTHEAFRTVPPTETLKYKDSSFISGVLSRLNAHEKNSKVTANDLFKSQKIVYGYDYADNDTDPTYAKSNHGVHVAGIAAGDNGGSFKGAAPHAQLAILKVFGNDKDSAYSNDIQAAIEDAVLINSDVINMSLGSRSGFSSDVTMDNILAKVNGAGITVCISAGNNYNGYYEFEASSKKGLITNPDNAVVGSSSTYSVPLSVANFKNTGAQSASTSWGPAPNLTLKPEIASVGDSVNSAIDNSSGYGNKTGTSMSSPNVSGVMAIIKQQLKAENPSLTPAKINERASRLLMSTAYVMGTSTTPLSPRVQGAGCANLTAAITTPAYLSVAGLEKPKLELGDDPRQTGKYEMKFMLTNTSDNALTYDLSTQTITETSSGNKIMMQSYLLSPETTYSVSGGTIDGTLVSVGAKGTAEITVTLSLTDADKTYLKKFTNGMYVEGFVKLTAAATNSAKVDLSIPFLAFYGDWTAAPVFDNMIYDGKAAATFDNALVGKFYTANNSAYEVELGKFSFEYRTGMLTAKEQLLLEPNYDLIAMNYYYNNDDSLNSNTFNSFQTFLLRNTKELSYTITDYDTGELVSEGSKKTNVRRNSESDKPFVLDLGMDFHDMANNGQYFSNNTRYSINFNARLDYGESGDIHDSRSIPFYVDFENPSLVGARTYTQGERTKLDVTVNDNHYVQAVKLYYKSAGNFVSVDNFFVPVLPYSLGQTSVSTIDITSYLAKLDESDDGNLYLYMVDYARNETYIKLSGVTENSSVEIGSSSESASGASSGVSASADLYDKYEKFVENDATYAKISDGNFVLLGYKNTAARTSLTIKGGTSRIGTKAFVGATNLKKIILPESLKRIGYMAFDGCTALQEFDFRGKTAPLLEYPFDSATLKENAHPYDNFAHSLAEDKPIADLRYRYGSAGFDSWVWTNQFNKKDVETYTVKFDVNGGEPIEDLKGDYADNVVPPLAVREGHDFVGWFSDENLTTEYVFGKFENITLYAKWERKSYKVSFDVNGGVINSLPEEKTLLYEEEIILGSEVPQKEGHTFLGWNDGKTDKYYQAGETYVVGAYDAVLKACFEINKYTVSYETYGGTEIASQTDVFGAKITAPASPSKKGYNFIGWYLDDVFTVEFNLDTIPSRDVTVYAKYEARNYSITFFTHENKRIKVLSLPYESVITETYAPKFYTFVHWVDSAGNVVLTVPATGMSLTAVIERSAGIVKYIADEDEIVEQIFNYSEDVVPCEPAPQKEGYTLVGWYTSEAMDVPFEFGNKMDSEEIVLYAKWTKNVYTIKFNMMGGDTVEDLIFEHGDTVTLPTPNRAGYEFVGWFVDEDCTLEYTNDFDENVTLYAGWEKKGMFAGCAGIGGSYTWWTLVMGGLTVFAYFTVTFLRKKRQVI